MMDNVQKGSNKMRNIFLSNVFLLNDDWKFSKEAQEIPTALPEDWSDVTVPHTWNALDGQDGGGDFYRGLCYYAKEIAYPQANEGDRIYLEFEGVANTADVYVNGQRVAHHEGGFSTFRADVTDILKKAEKNLLVVGVDNSHQDNVYPQVADFTFYGGIYRDVSCIVVPATHFDLDYFGGSGLRVSSRIEGENAWVTAETFVKNAQAGDQIVVSVLDENEQTVAEAYLPAQEGGIHSLFVPTAHLWQGVEDPYLYTVSAQIVRNNDVLDEVECKLGIREFYVDPEKGFFLNGKSMPLRGVSRHQDKLGIGNALTNADHWDDALLIKEMGCNTVRLAHYQHNQAFYEVCDLLGFIVWAEIPFISSMNADPEAHLNARSQMQELIIQNYNHPSICFWGISNEITIGGDSEKLVDNLRDLNELVHTLDPTRLTTMAQVAMLPMESEHNQITDIVSYNHYFGWYFGEKEENEKWFDAFHEKYPDRAIGISEYGCEANIRIHTDKPGRGDYSEEYQAVYHEHMAKVIEERPWLWATHNWNMFDFAADNRDEGGVKGRNNKGLVTMDRKVKKDSFFLYKAYWSTEPFVHITGRRYADRPYGKMAVKVYSNQPSVTLYIDGKEFATEEGEKVFVFSDVPLDQEYTFITAEAGESADTVTFHKVNEANPDYVLADAVDMSNVQNWFEEITDTTDAPVEINPSFYSTKDTIGDILLSEEAGDTFAEAMRAITKMMVKKGSLSMMSEQKAEDLLNNFSIQITPAELNHLNRQLQKIKKDTSL